MDGNRKTEAHLPASTNEGGEAGLGNSISRGAAWMVVLSWTERGIGLVSSIILARLLAPEDFGLVALAMSVYALVRLLRQFGFSSALIQNQVAGRKHYDTAWTLQLLLSILAASILLLSAPVAASLYEDARLEPVLTVLAITFFVTGLNNVGVVNFEKGMKFEKVFVLNVVPKLVSFVITIALALYLRNYWALLLGQASNLVMGVVMSYVMQGYRPRLSLSAWRDLMGFSSWLLINNIITYLNRHGRNIVLAKFGGAPMVGIVMIATDFATIVSVVLIAPINTAAYPGYAKVAGQREKLAKTFRDVISAISVISIPGGVGLAALAPLFVPVLLGEKWLEATEVVPPIAIASILISMMTAIDRGFMAVAKQRITTFLVTARLLIFFPLMIVLLKDYGVEGVAYAVLLSNAAIAPLYLAMLPGTLGVSVTAFLSSVIRPSVSAIVMYAVVSLYIGETPQQRLDVNGVISLFSTILLGATVYIGCLYSLWWASGRKDGFETRILDTVRKRLAL